MSDVGLSVTDLTVPADDSQTVRQLLSKYLGRQYRDLVTLKIPSSGAQAEALSIVQRHCRALASESPGALFSALQHTTVGGLLRYLREGAIASPSGAALMGQLAALLYAEFALAGAAPPPILLSPSPSRILIASTRTSIHFPAGSSALRLRPEGITVVGTGGVTMLTWDDVHSGRSPGIEPSHVPLAGRCGLALADDSPLSQFETHPDKSGSGLDLGGKSPDEWSAALREAIALVRCGVPVIADEIELLIEQLIPVGYDAEKHLSASYTEYVGTIYLSLHPDVLTLAEALIHEHSHNKINMLWTLAPVLENAFSPLYSSPFRPDPRPLHGVLLGVHAFIPVERLYEQLTVSRHPIMRKTGIDGRRRRVRERNAAACEMLALHAQPTASGRSVLEEIARWNARYAGAPATAAEHAAERPL